MNASFTAALAASITKTSSAQTYYTVRFLVDRERVADAYRCYAYFRWVDDQIDLTLNSRSERLAFVERQKTLIDKCYDRQPVGEVIPEEAMLVDLIQGDTEESSGLQMYIRNMMAIMSFDADRRGKIISQHELNSYTRWLAVAVTEAMHHFIGHGS